MAIVIDWHNLAIAEKTIRKHYHIKRRLAVLEIDGELANLRRKEDAGSMDDSQERLAAALTVAGVKY